MHSKYTTANKVAQAGIRVIIANGEREEILVDLIEHKDRTPHTEFTPVQATPNPSSLEPSSLATEGDART
jgi:glutamate 5-kinase